MSDRRVRVPVPPPSERDWERAERRLVAARAAELAAAPPPDLRRGTRRLALLTALVAGMAAGTALMAWRMRTPVPAPTPTVAVAPVRVTTPAGTTSRLELGDAVVVVGPDAALSVEREAGGAITVRLERGGVDCDVAPRPGRAPFAVVAHDVTVTVVGTRFVVEDGAGGVRVGVRRGKVRVADATGGERQVGAGQGWTALSGVAPLAEVLPEVAAAAAREGDALAVAGPVHGAAATPAAPPPAATAPRAERDEPASTADASPTVDPTVAPADALAEAVALEPRDPDAAAARYAQLVDSAAGIDEAVAEEAAFRAARLALSRARWDAATAAAREYEQRFPRGARLEAILWFRVEAACGAYRSRDAERAARDYLRRFPDGAHAAAARSGAVCGVLGR